MDDRVFLTYDEAIKRLPDKTRIHTFRQTSLLLLGADWDRKDILKAIKKYGAEEAGPLATKSNHGLVLFDEAGPLYIETRPESPITFNCHTVARMEAEACDA